MSPGPGPDWLAVLQARFGETIRTPLDRAQGVLRPQASAYPAALVETVVGGHREGLAVYNLQYWLRLFEALQTELPLTCRLLGAWDFNGWAERFLLAQPPRGWDLEQAASGFETFLAQAMALAPELQVDAEAVREAAQVDVAWREVLRAPESTPLLLDSADGTRLPGARLVRAAGARCLEEHWPWIEQRQAFLSAAPERRLTLPARWGAPRHWLLLHRPTGVLQAPLEPDEAHLLRLLEALPLQDALGELEATCPAESRAALPSRAQAWIARGMQRGVWSELR